MAAEQTTLGEQNDIEQVREYIENRRWTHYEVADELDVTPEEIMDLIHAHDIEYTWSACGANASGPAKKLWEMDPDELGGGA